MISKGEMKTLKEVKKLLGDHVVKTWKDDYEITEEQDIYCDLCRIVERFEKNNPLILDANFIRWMENKSIFGDNIYSTENMSLFRYSRGDKRIDVFYRASDMIIKVNVRHRYSTGWRGVLDGERVFHPEHDGFHYDEVKRFIEYNLKGVEK